MAVGSIDFVSHIGDVELRHFMGFPEGSMMMTTEERMVGSDCIRSLPV